MRYLLIALMIVSCALPTNTRKKHKPLYRTSIDRMYGCLIRLIEVNGIGATEAQKVCQKTLRRK